MPGAFPNVFLLCLYLTETEHASLNTHLLSSYCESGPKLVVGPYISQGFLWGRHINSIRLLEIFVERDRVGL